MESEARQLDQDDEQEDQTVEGFQLFKGKEEAMPEATPEVVYFQPAKEHYDNPEELIQEYRDFVNNDLQEGQVVHVEHRHAKQMAEWQRQQLRPKSKPKPKTEEGSSDGEWFEAEKEIVQLDRKEILKILLEQLGMDVLILFGQTM